MMKNELYHHGVKGMKWGVRRYQNEDGSLTDKGKKRYYEDYTLNAKSKNGDTINLYRKKPLGFAKLIGNNDSISSRQNDFYNYEAYVKGKKVGTLLLDRESVSSINVNWLGVKETERGKGYAQAIMRSAISLSKKEGYKQMTLEVPGHSPDARHVYEKYGFKAGKVLTTAEEDRIWDGLTSMKKKL